MAFFAIELAAFEKQEKRCNLSGFDRFEPRGFLLFQVVRLRCSKIFGYMWLFGFRHFVWISKEFGEELQSSRNIFMETEFQFLEKVENILKIGTNRVQTFKF